MGTNLVVQNTQLWQSYNGIVIPSTDQRSIIPLSSHFKLLTPLETQKIVKAFEGDMHDVGLEYAWNRSKRVLDDKLEYFGLDFLAEMVDRDSLSSLDELSVVEKINLAFELGMINSSAMLALLQANETINHFWTREVAQREEIDISDAFKIIKDLAKYILANEMETSAMAFKQFRDKLQTILFTTQNEEIDTLKTSPYFYIKTTIRTLLSLIKDAYKNKNLAELTKVLHNTELFIVELWEKIFIEDRKLIGTTYSESISDGQKEVFTTFSRLLDNVQGYDYVPETTRSNAYKKIAKGFVSAHYEFDNFHNEPAFAKKLNSMGTVIPDFALQEVLRAVLLSIIGNQYGTSNGAQAYNHLILKKVSSDQWKVFFANLIIQDQNILEKLTYGNTTMLNKWIEVIRENCKEDFNIENPLAKKIYEFTIKSEIGKIKIESGKALSKILGNK